MKLNQLVEKLTAASNAYYNSPSPIMSDEEFDALYDYLKKIDPNNSFFKRVGAPIVNSEWKKAKHEISMGSLEKVQNENEMTDWIREKSKNKSIVVMDKLDGYSINLVYSDGKLIQAISRGDGYEGEDILLNVAKMHGVPLILQNNFSGSIRGEIVLLRSNHKEFFKDYSNPRNAIGAAKKLNGENADKFDVYLYQAIGNIEFKSEIDQLEFLKSNHCQVPQYELIEENSIEKICDKVNSIYARYQEKDRANLPYDIDGLVIRINDIEYQSALGEKDLKPKWSVAFKFPSESKITTLRNILWQTGNSGRITPIAVFDSINILGANITQASLHNYFNIQELGIDIGSEILVSRKNDVIPYVEKCIYPTKHAKHPKTCPSCNQDVNFDGKYLVCLNENCPALISGNFFVWIKNLNLMEWGEALIIRLIEANLIKTIPDLYELSLEQLSSLERMGIKSAQKCLDTLHAKKSISLEEFIGSLNIPSISISTIKLITKSNFDTLEKIQKISLKDLENINGLGPVKAEALINGLKERKELIFNILKHIQIKKKEIGLLSNKSICFTGSMKNKRSTLEEMARKNGAEIKSSVGKGLNFLVIADPNSNSIKATTARKNGTKCISEEEFLNMLR